MIKALILDFGNVISLPQNGDCYKKMETLTGIRSSVFADAFEKYREPFDLGEITGAQMYSAIFADNGRLDLADDSNFCAMISKIDMDSWQYYNKELTEWAINIQKNGYSLGILSNMPTEFLSNYEKSIPLFTHADYAVFSCRVKLLKPGRDIYYKVLEGLSIQPEEAVFFDDLRANIKTANEIGIHGFLFTDLEQAKKDWKSVLSQ